MPLPAPGSVWPPANLDAVTARLCEWSAWYSGNPEELEYAYGAATGGFDSTSRARVQNHPSQYRGGVVGRLARFWWGAPVDANQPRTKLHVPLASDIATASADLLFSEPPTITVPDDTTTQDRLLELVDDGWHAKLLEAADVAAGLGGVYLRVCWNVETRDRPWMSVQHADAAVPEWNWDELKAVTFWRVIEADEKHVVRHLERHEPGYILNAVYDGTKDNLGKLAPLTAWPETEDLDAEILTGIKKLTATYIPNMRPNKLWRSIPQAAPLGRADIGGSETFLDALDETWTSWMRDVRNGKGRLIVPETYLQSMGPGEGARFDAEREVWHGINMLGSPDGNQLTVAQFAIRVQEHRDTVHEQIETVLRSAGYSADTFGLTDGGASGASTPATKAEVVSKERRSLITRDKKTHYWKPGLADFVETFLMIDAVVFKSGVEPVRPDVQFGDTVQESIDTLAQTASLLRAAEAASTQTLVELVHPDWDETQVDEEVARIESETAPPPLPPAPGDLGMGGDGAGGADPNADPMAALQGY